MSKFCSKCGAELKDGAKFCNSCGQPTAAPQPETPKCPSCGAELKTTSKFCNKCGQPIAAPTQTFSAPAQADTQTSEKKNGFFAELLDLIKHPMRLLPTIIISVIWIVISILWGFAVKIPGLDVIAAITYSKGGLFGGVLGAVGGIFGKAVFAAVLNAFVMALFQKRNPFKGFGKGFGKTAFSGGLKAAAPFLIASGAGILLYLFFNVTSSPQNIAVAVAGAIASIQAAGTRNGIFFTIFFGIAGKLSKGKIPSQMTISRVLTGFSAGCAVGIPITFIRMPLVMLIVGAVLLAGGIVCAIIGSNNAKKVAATMAVLLLVGASFAPIGMVKADAADGNSFTMKLMTDEDHDSAGYIFQSFNIELPMYYAAKSAGTINATDSGGKLTFTIPAYSGTVKGFDDDDNTYQISTGAWHFTAPSFGEKHVRHYNNMGDYEWYVTYATLSSPVDITVVIPDYADVCTKTVKQTVKNVNLGLAVEKNKNGTVFMYTGGTTAMTPGQFSVFAASWDGSYQVTEVYESHTNEEKPYSGTKMQFGSEMYFRIEGGTFFTGNDELPPEVAQVIMVSILTSLLGGGLAAALTAMSIVFGNAFTSTLIPPTPPVPSGPSAPPNSPTPPDNLGPHITRDEDGDLNTVDPATGENHLYVSNGDGTYTNPLTGATYTLDELRDHLDSRSENANLIRQDQKAAQKAIAEQRAANQELSQDAKDYLLQKWEDDARYQDEERIFNLWLKYGGSDDMYDEKAIRDALEKKQAWNLKSQESAHRIARNIDIALKVAETTQVAADIGVDVLATVTGQTGIKQAYTVGKNFAGRLSDAHVNNKSMKTAMVMAGLDSLADLGLDKAEELGFHVSGNIGADSFKKITQNVCDGKDWNDGLGQTMVTGATKGTFAKIGSALNSGQSDITKQQLKTDLYGLLKAQKGGMSPKGVRTLRDMRLITYTNNLKAEQGMAVLTTLGVDVGKTTADGISSAYSDLGGGS